MDTLNIAAIEQEFETLLLKKRVKPLILYLDKLKTIKNRIKECYRKYKGIIHKQKYFLEKSINDTPLDTHLPQDCIKIIFDKLTFPCIVKYGLTSSKSHQLVTNFNYTNMIRIKNEVNLKTIMSQYKINKINLHNTKVTDKSVAQLGACHTLDLSDCWEITDKSVAQLGACHTLDLSCTKVTDESVARLGACHALDLSGTDVIDESVARLGACHALNLDYTIVTDESVVLLGACHTLDLSGTNVTDKSVTLLGTCHTLYLNNTIVTDESVARLGACHTLYLSSTKVTNELRNKLRAIGVLIKN